MLRKKRISFSHAAPATPESDSSTPCSSEWDIPVIDRFSIPQNEFSEVILDDMIKTGWANVLRNCINQLTLLSTIYTDMASRRVVDQIHYESVEDRCKDCTLGYGNRMLSHNINNYHRLQKEIGIVIFMLNDLIIEVNRYGTAFSVSIMLEKLIKTHEDEKKFFNDLAEKQKKAKIARRVLSREKSKNPTFEAYYKAIKMTSRRYSDEQETARQEIQFTKKWEMARYEQNLMTLQMKEQSFANTINSMRMQIAKEDLCHDEMTQYMEESQQDYADEMTEWIEKYDASLEAKDSDIYSMRMRVEVQKDKMEELTTKYQLRERILDDWKEYKRKIKLVEERIALETAAAITIQTFWRQTMIKKKLGPYAKKKKSKKGGKKGKVGKERKK